MTPHATTPVPVLPAMARSRTAPSAALPAAASGAQAQAAAPVLALTYGTFDLFHIGHVRLFERIRQRCDRLVVAVSTDEFNAVKGKRSVVSFADRVAMVKACRHVDEVIAEEDWGQKPRDIRAFGVDLFVMGDDWTGHFDDLASMCEVLYLPRTLGISSTGLKQTIRSVPAPSTATAPAAVPAALSPVTTGSS